MWVGLVVDAVLEAEAFNKIERFFIKSREEVIDPRSESPDFDVVAHARLDKHTSDSNSGPLAEGSDLVRARVSGWVLKAVVGALGAVMGQQFSHDV